MLKEPVLKEPECKEPVLKEPVLQKLVQVGIIIAHENYGHDELLKKPGLKRTCTKTACAIKNLY